MIAFNCSLCGRALQSESDRHRLLHLRCVDQKERISSRMTCADWDAVAGWLNPGRTRPTGQLGPE